MKKTLVSLAAAAALSVVSAVSFADSAVMNDVTEGAQMKTGKEIYTQLCAACHMADGSGGVGAGKFPAFKDNMRLMAAQYPMHIVLYGQKGMPGFGKYFSDEQVAEVVNYLRTNFGNKFEADVKPEDVAKLRSDDVADYGDLF